MLIPLLAALLITLAPPDSSLTPADPPDLSTPTLIANLKSSAPDPLPRNALNTLICRGRLAVPSLYAALESPDFQQRQLAAAALRALSRLSQDSAFPYPSESIPVEPTDALLRVCIEGLKSDALPGDPSNLFTEGLKPPVSNAASGTRFLIHHAAKAEPLLAAALKSFDLQQRFCAALILGFAHRTAHAETICSILIPHLRDNSIPSDALWAASALYRLGPAADIHLQAAAIKPLDRQQRELLALILLDIRKPLPLAADYGPRTAGKLTTLQLDGDFDPLIAFDQYSLHMDWGPAMTERNRDTPRPSTPAPGSLLLHLKPEQ